MGNECALKSSVFGLTRFGGFSLKANECNGVGHVQHASVQPNDTVCSVRGETWGDFEREVMSEGMRLFHCCVTQIKPDGDNDTLSTLFWLLKKSSSRPSSCPMASGCVRSLRPAESLWNLLLLMDWLDDCVIRLDIQWLPGNFNQSNQSAINGKIS